MIGRIHFTGIVIVTDTVAMGSYRGLQACKVCIPQDVFVVRFDNAYFVWFLNPPLMTINISRKALNYMTMEALLQPRLQAGRRGSFKLGTDLILRESTAPPNARSRTMRFD
ncbi:substrate-binding domain-containing protein [Edaphobacter dinghuensis]|uniref:substrate-binding domain-containing protein n=1 Tax=Edaphobacter dinghuensis TaxID=1560005 RepID=UPI001663AA2B